MALSFQDIKNIMSAVVSQSTGNTVVDGVNAGLLASHVIANLIVATNVSATIDFAGKLSVGDKVVMIPAVAGNSIFYTVVTAGTLPAAAVVGNLYVVIRAKDAASAVKF